MLADERYQIIFQAQSGNDEDAPVSETTISLQLEAAKTAGGLGGGLEEVDKDTMVMYASIGAAVLFGLIFVVALAKALRRKANAQPMYVPPVELDDEEEDEDDLDLSELDDLFGEDDDDPWDMSVDQKEAGQMTLVIELKRLGDYFHYCTCLRQKLL